MLAFYILKDIIQLQDNKIREEMYDLIETVLSHNPPQTRERFLELQEGV